MKINRNKISEPESVTIIAAGTTMTGKIESNQPIRIEGRFIGDINGKGTVTTCSDSSVQGNIEADEIIIGGQIKGELSGFTSITIQHTGAVEGSIQSDTIIIEKGGLFEGECLMTQKEVEIIEMGPKLLEKQA
ncbi:MAG: polymer-forming cytoskeletal protein [Cytophagia bacterium]|nr:polymer-forming cytoskeletal protein [Cytophagia bacterium]